MHIQFKTKRLASLCNEIKKATQEWGKQNALKLAQRLQELQAADSLDDISKLPPARCHELRKNRKGQFAVVLQGKMRLIFVPDHDPLPTLKEGGADWRQITRIVVVSVEDYHE